MTTKELIGAHIKSLRQSIGLSQEQLAEKMNISSKYLSSIERGKENPTLNTFLKLSASLGVEVQEVFNFAHELSSNKELKKVLNNLLKGAKDEKLRLAVKIMKGIWQ